MPTAESAVSSLNIHRLRSLYLVPSDHPAPDAIRSKLDNVARRKFGDAIASALSRALPDSTAGVWLIRSLTLNVDLNLDASEDRLAEIWARQAAVSVAMVLQDNAKADQVLHFASSAAHLAHFLRDLADGSAWDKWYYRKFDGLRSLPLSPSTTRNGFSTKSPVETYQNASSVSSKSIRSQCFGPFSMEKIAPPCISICDSPDSIQRRQGRNSRLLSSRSSA